MPGIRAASSRRLRELRATRGGSQDVLGAGGGLTGEFGGEVERGEKSISLDILARPARALRVPFTAMPQGL